MKDFVKPYRVRVETLGCKVNQVDSAAMLTDLRAHGFVEAGEGDSADVVIINSCTVTANADRDVRKMISRARAENANALIALTGCLSATGSSGQERADIVTGNLEKAFLTDLILEKIEGRSFSKTGKLGGFFGAGAVDLTGHARAFVKVQDGCNMSCAYCVVPLVRGRSRSRPVEGIVGEVRALHAKGYHEVVLTGVHIGQFGEDSRPRESLAGLIRAILADTDLPRVRISSIEPFDVGDDLIAILAEDERLCRHLHIPLQSGDDGVLARMRRPYRRADYLELASRIAGAAPDTLIGSDIIVGFPGETEKDFEQTLSLAREVEFDNAYIFKYSPR